MPITLPDDMQVRAPTLNDLEAVSGLLNGCAVAEYGTPEWTTDEVRSDWEWAKFNLATDAWLIISPDGQPVGYAAVWRGPLTIFGEAYVHPQQRGRGIGSYLLGQIEARAMQALAETPDRVQITLRQEISSANQAGQQLLERAGYAIIRHDWQMEIVLSEAPPMPMWPDGIIVRTLAPGQDERAVHACAEEAFQQNRGYIATPFEHWAQTMTQHDWHDPTLWFLATDGAEIAGAALCRKRKADKEMGWVNILAVRRPWRHKGLGMALLRYSFAEFYRRGIFHVGLTVDSENITGATQLYERAGMHVARQYTRYEKKLLLDKG